MGLYSSAALIFGFPVNSEDNPDLWEAEDWKPFDYGLFVSGYGHYENPDGYTGILTHTRFPLYRVDCWDPALIDSLVVGLRERIEADRALRAAKFASSWTFSKAKWCLVASYG